MALTEKTFKQLYDKAVARNNIVNRYSKAFTGQSNTPRANTTPFVPQTQTVQAQPVATASNNNSDWFDELYKRAETYVANNKAQTAVQNVANSMPFVQQTVPQQTQQMPVIQDQYNNLMYNQGFGGDVNAIPGTIETDRAKASDYLAYRAERDAADTAQVANNSPFANSGMSDEQIVRLENQGYTGGSHMAGKYRALPLIAAEGTVGSWVNDVEASAQLLGSKEATDYYDFLQNTQNGGANTNAGEEVGKFFTYKDKLGKQKLDPNGKGYWILDQRDKLLADTMEDLTPAEQFVTSTAISALQNLELMPVMLIPGLSQAAKERIILGLMSSSAMGNTIYEKSKMGKTLNDAYVSGIIDGTIEGATEMIGVDERVKAFTGKSGSLLKSLAVQSGAEGAEEAIGYIANYWVDKARKDPDAKFSAQEFLTNTLSGALSGLMLGGISNVSGMASMSPEERSNYIHNRYSMENGVYEAPVTADQIEATSARRAMANPTSLVYQPSAQQGQNLNDLLLKNQSPLGIESIANETAPQDALIGQAGQSLDDLLAQAPQQTVEEAPVQERPVPSETPEKIPSPLETEDAERYIKSLESTGKDNKGYRQYVSTSLERLEDALKIVDSDLYNAYLAEANSGEVSSPIIDTVINMDNVVRGDLVSPMAMARFLSRAYKAEGIEGLRNVYSRLDYTNPKVYQQILDGALPSEASNVTQTESTTSQVEKKQAKTPKAKKNPHTKSYNNALAGAKRKVKSGKHDFMSVLRDATNNYYLSVDELSDLYDDLVAYSDKNNLMVGYPRKEDVLKSHKGYKATENVAQSVEERSRRDIKFAGELRTPEEILRDRVELNQEDIEDWISEHDRTLNELEADEIDQGEWEFEKKYGMTMDTARSILNDIETERLAKEPLEGQVNFEESIKAEPKEQKPKATPKGDIAEKRPAPSSERYDDLVKSTIGETDEYTEEVVYISGGYVERFIVNNDLVVSVSPDYKSKTIPVNEYNLDAGDKYYGETPPFEYDGDLGPIPDNAMEVKDKKSGTKYFRVDDNLFLKSSVEKLQGISDYLMYDDADMILVGYGDNDEITGYVMGTPAEEFTVLGQRKVRGMLNRHRGENAHYYLSGEQAKYATPKADKAKTKQSSASEIDPEQWDRVEKELASEKRRKENERNGIIASYAIPDETFVDMQRHIDNANTIVKEIVDGFNKVFNPTRKRTKQEIDTFFDMKGEREKTLAQLQRTIEPLKEKFDNMSTAECREFIDNYQNGRPQATSELQKIDEFIRKTIEPLTEGLLEIDPDASMRENYLPQIWKESGKKLRDAYSTLNRKRGLVGDTFFRKQRIYDTYVEGMNAGLTPLTLNPIELLEHIVSAETQYITAHKMFNKLKEMGAIKFIPQTQATPEGYVDVDDNLFKVYYPTEIKRLGQIGRYVATEGAGAMLHNWVMANGVRSTAIGNTLANTKNNVTQIELAFSGFHYIQTFMTAFQESFNIGLQNLVNNKDISGAGRMLNPLAMNKTMRDGKTMIDYMLDEETFLSDPKNVEWLNKHPEAKLMAELWWKGGGKLSQSNYEEMGKRVNRSFDRILKDLADSHSVPNLFRGGVDAVRNASNAITQPLFEDFIPQLKVGFFMEQMAHDMSVYQDDLISGQKTLTELARSNIDTMDDLFGAMNYDNRNWNRTMKQVLQIIFRSPTWWYGNVHMGRGIVEETANVGKALLSKNQKAVLGKNTGFAVGMLFVTSVVGSIIHTLLSGERPKDWKDMFAPWTGRYNKNGEKERLAAPGYIKSWFNLYTNPKSSVTSATSGFIDVLYRLYKNEDFYGNYIRDPSDSIPEQIGQVDKYLIKEIFYPFTISNVVEDYKNAKQDDGTVDWEHFIKNAVTDLAGMSKAPDMITTSKFKRDVAKAYEKNVSWNSQPGSPNDADKREAKADLRERIFDGTATDEEIQKAIEDGVISLASAKSAKMYTYAYQWDKLPQSTRTSLWNSASDEEKQVLAAVELKKDPDKQNSNFVKEWKNGELQVPGQDEFSRMKVYRTATFEEKQAALQFYYQYMGNKDTAAYQDKDMSDTFNTTNRLVNAGYSPYEAVMFRQVLKGIEGNKNEKGKTITGSRRTNRINALIRKGYSRKEAEKIVSLYENK
jgi:hypothetical protein